MSRFIQFPIYNPFLWQTQLIFLILPWFVFLRSHLPIIKFLYGITIQKCSYLASFGKTSIFYSHQYCYYFWMMKKWLIHKDNKLIAFSLFLLFVFPLLQTLFAGSGLDDNRWHTVKLKRRAQDLELTLDGHEPQKGNINSSVSNQACSVGQISSYHVLYMDVNRSLEIDIMCSHRCVCACLNICGGKKINDKILTMLYHGNEYK